MAMTAKALQVRSWCEQDRQDLRHCWIRPGLRVNVHMLAMPPALPMHETERCCH